MLALTNKLGTLGIVIALFAVTIAIFQDRIRTETAPTETTISARVIDKTANLLRLNSKTNTTKYDAVSYSYIGLGLLALILGVSSYLRKESRYGGSLRSCRYWMGIRTHRSYYCNCNPYPCQP